MIKERYSILNISNKELIQVIKNVNNLNETNGYILGHMSLEGKGHDPIEIFSNTAKIAANLLVKRTCDKKDGETIPIKPPKAKSAKKTSTKKTK